MRPGNGEPIAAASRIERADAPGPVDVAVAWPAGRGNPAATVEGLQTPLLQTVEVAGPADVHREDRARCEAIDRQVGPGAQRLDVGQAAAEHREKGDVDWREALAEIGHAVRERGLRGDPGGGVIAGVVDPESVDFDQERRARIG